MKNLSLEKMNIQHIKPLTQSQMLLWTGQMLHPDSPMYNMVMTFDLKGTIEVTAFKTAFQTLIKDSDVLRLIIKLEENVPLQYILTPFDYDLEYIDLSTDSAKEETFKKWLEQRSQVMFDLSKNLFDSALIKFSETRYIWYFNQHHLVTDGWSLTVLYQAMAERYQQVLQNTTEEVSDLPQFHNYVDYEKGVYENQKNKKSYNYWQEKLKTLPTPPRLYGESGVKGVSSSERVLVNLGLERSDQLRALTKERDLRALSPHLSLFNIFSTVLFGYLYRTSGQQNLVVGAPSHHRPTTTFKQTPGVFIEIFPMQAEVNPEDTWMDLFRRVRTEVSHYLRHAKLGMASPDLSRSFNVLLNYISGTFSDFNEIPMQSEWVLPGHTDPEHHLRLQIHDFDSTGAIQLHFDMNTEVFDADLRQQAPQRFVRLLDHFTKNRMETLTTPDILGQEERTHILKGLNDTKKEFFPKEQHMLTGFEAQVEKTPDAAAVIYENTVLSYADFNKKVNQIGRFLQEKGIGTEDVVAICMERSLEMPLAMYGILKAGAAFLPIDPKHPQERIDFILKDAGVKLVFTQAHLLENMGTTTIPMVALIRDWSKIVPYPNHNLNLDIAPRSLAYVIYTSGSTGKPKGVMVEHRSICNRLEWIKDIVPSNETDKVLQKTPYTFDVSVPEFFSPLQVGAQLIMARPDGHKNPTYLVETIQRYGITTIHFVPSMLTIFLEEKGLENCQTLRRVFCSGEAITIAQQNSFFEIFNIELHNLYGPTEAAVEVTRWQCQPDDKGQIVPIGVPVANTQIYILDEHLQPVPIGTPGELYIAGIQVARGYLNRPELTAERFVPDPYSSEPDASMYRSGDLARHRPDGVIEYLGRVDYQIKLRGFRIELGEIEAILESHPAIAQAVVVLQEEQQNKQLVAYYLGTKIEDNLDLKNYLSTHLPDYMIPAHFKYLEEFPLGSSGKVKRSALPKIDLQQVQQEVKYVAPRTDLEEMIAEIWSEILSIDQIGVYDNFFDLGGHSLTAIRLMSRVHEMLELTLPINLVFDKPTIAAYAAHVESIIETLLAEMDEAEIESSE